MVTELLAKSYKTRRTPGSIEARMKASNALLKHLA